MKKEGALICSGTIRKEDLSAISSSLQSLLFCKKESIPIPLLCLFPFPFLPLSSIMPLRLKMKDMQFSVPS